MVVKLPIPVIQEVTRNGGARAAALFVRLKALYVSGAIRDFKNLNFTKFGYATRKPFMADVRRLYDLGYLRAKDRNVKHGKVTDVYLISTHKILARVYNKPAKSCWVSFESTSRNLKEELLAAILQDSFCKQCYKAEKSSTKNLKNVIVVNTSTMDSRHSMTLEQNSLSKLSFKEIAKKLGYNSPATAFKLVTRMIELGLFKKFNQVEKIANGMRFKGIENVKVLCNIYEVTNSILPKMSKFKKPLAL